MNSKPDKRRVGVFAGAFDPIHDGHLEVAREAIKYLELDELVFMVEAEPWGAKKPAALNHRQEMVRLAIAQDRKMSLLELTDARFTIDKTLPKIEQQFTDSELYFIFGADVFLNMNIKQWPDLPLLLEHYLVIFERGALTEIDIARHAKELGISIAILASTHPHHRSSNVRLKSYNKALWVPASVAKYIEACGLYGV
jgi:nicotinate-nucleotide adenylyltransferase